MSARIFAFVKGAMIATMAAAVCVIVGMRLPSVQNRLIRSQLQQELMNSPLQIEREGDPVLQIDDKGLQRSLSESIGQIDCSRSREGDASWGRVTYVSTLSHPQVVMSVHAGGFSVRFSGASSFDCRCDTDEPHAIIDTIRENDKVIVLDRMSLQ